MARSSVSLGAAPAQYSAGWAASLIQRLTEMINLAQRVNEEYEPPRVTPAAGSRIILADTNGVRYAVTVSTAGALVVTAL